MVARQVKLQQPEIKPRTITSLSPIRCDECGQTSMFVYQIVYWPNKNLRDQRVKATVCEHCFPQKHEELENNLKRFLEARSQRKKGHVDRDVPATSIPETEEGEATQSTLFYVPQADKHAKRFGWEDLGR